MPDVLDKMFQCGPDANYWLRHTMTQCFPRELLEQWHQRLTFLSAEYRDGFRVNKSLRETRELVFLSEHIAPCPGMNEAHPVVRYFMFVCLHESVHVIRQHRPPNEISAEENEAQEAEADQLALEWINSYLRVRNHSDMPLFERDEIEEAQARNREIMRRPRDHMV
jgi:hypothetical protein